MRGILLKATVLSLLTSAAFGGTEERASDHWDICGSFGRVEGSAVTNADVLSARGTNWLVETKIVRGKGGVESRRTRFTNTSDRPVSARCLLDRWVFEGGEWDVYTQSSGWQHESRGAWQPLHTCVAARCDGVRSCEGAAPVLAVWNRAAGRGRVFHLLSDVQWSLRAENRPVGGEFTSLVVEAGFDTRYLDYALKPGESVAFPEVISYAFENRTDLDCHRLHAYWNARRPSRGLPAIYNSWLCRFDKLDFDFVLKQIARAKEIGFDYFVIDAGWFGPSADWDSVRGDWAERSDGYLKGRLADVAAAVREAGMKFGFWLEPEAAVEKSEAYRQHPAWFVRSNNALFFDFRNPEAFAHMVETTGALVKKYGAEFLKFDFNQTTPFDPTGRNFADYTAAYRRFVDAVRAAHPGLYVEGCAAGGQMMDLAWAETYDSFWPTDNQSIYHSFRIAKDTMLRLPPRCIERWLTLRRVTGLQPDYFGGDSRLLTTEDGTWTRVRSVTLPYVDAFTAGGPFAMSCDLLPFTDADVAHFHELIASRRADGAFWQKAVGRVVADADGLTALQYSDEALTDVRLFVVPARPRTRTCVIRPVVDPTKSYSVDGARRTGSDLVANGVVVNVKDDQPKEIRIKE